MPALLPIGVAAVALVAGYAIWHSSVRARRADFIRVYTLPKGLFDRLKKKRPHLTDKDCSLVARGLRQFFLSYLNSGRRFVSMPSQAVDDLWHELILYTREYESFCRKAFGGFLHHSPAVVLGTGDAVNLGLRRAWWQACKEE